MDKKPVLIEDDKISLDKLKDICKEYIDFIEGDEFSADNDFETYISERALTTLFGDNVFEFINEKLQ